MIHIIDTITQFLVHMCRKGSLRQKLFAWRIEQEIHNRIAPHIHNERNHGYAFADSKGLWKAAYHGELDARLFLENAEALANQTGKAHGDALRYIMYRDLNQRLAMYRQFMAERVQPATCDPRFVATHA